MTSRHSLTRDSPIFVDRTGKRRRWITALGAGGGTLLITALGVLVAGLVGAGPGHLPALPGLAPQHQQGDATVTEGPSPGPTSDEPTGVPSPTPGPTGPTTSTSPTPRVKGKPSTGPSHPVRPTKSR